jgi:hypothetical protein
MEEASAIPLRVIRKTGSTDMNLRRRRYGGVTLMMDATPVDSGLKSRFCGMNSQPRFLEKSSASSMDPVRFARCQEFAECECEQRDSWIVMAHDTIDNPDCFQGPGHRRY